MSKSKTKKFLRLVFVLTLTLLISYVDKNYGEVTLDQIFDEEVFKSEGTFVTVSRVVDGDTLKVKIRDSEETVRLIGIDTPETVDPRKSVECFGNEASSRMKELVEGKTIKLESDPTQSARDKYGRILAYVYLEDGTFVNQKMIEEGYAFEYTYIIPYKYQKEFKTLEDDARTKGSGLWETGVCEYSHN